MIGGSKVRLSKTSMHELQFLFHNSPDMLLGWSESCSSFCCNRLHFEPRHTASCYMPSECEERCDATASKGDAPNNAGATVLIQRIALTISTCIFFLGGGGRP